MYGRRRRRLLVELTKHEHRAWRRGTTGNSATVETPRTRPVAQSTSPSRGARATNKRRAAISKRGERIGMRVVATPRWRIAEGMRPRTSAGSQPAKAHHGGDRQSHDGKRTARGSTAVGGHRDRGRTPVSPIRSDGFAQGQQARDVRRWGRRRTSNHPACRVAGRGPGPASSSRAARDRWAAEFSGCEIHTQGLVVD